MYDIGTEKEVFASPKIAVRVPGPIYLEPSCPCVGTGRLAVNQKVRPFSQNAFAH